MEELPPEIISKFYPYLDPKSYRHLSQTGRRYRGIGLDPYLLKHRIIKDPKGKWIAKVNNMILHINKFKDIM